MLFPSGFIMTDHNHVRRGCHYHVRRGYVRLYESWFDSMSRWFDHELPQPRPTWLWLPRPFPPWFSNARRSSSAIHIHGGAGGDYPVCGCEQEYATLRTSRDTSPPLQDFAKARGEGASPRGEGWAQGTGDLSRIGYALGGTRAGLGVLFVLPPGPLALGH